MARGFTLIELAIALLILGLLLGGLLRPFSSQVEARRDKATVQSLDQINDALVGYAVIYGHLPCPTWPDSPEFGEPDCAHSPSQGLLPWKTLGVDESDPWGNHWRYRPDSAFMATFNIDTNSSDDLSVYTDDDRVLAGSLSYSENGVPMEIPPPVAVTYSTGPNGEPDDRNTTYDSEYFSASPESPGDDRAAWLSKQGLLSVMLSAGVLP